MASIFRHDVCANIGASLVIIGVDGSERIMIPFIQGVYRGRFLINSSK